MMDVKPRRQTRHRIARGEPADRRLPLLQPLCHAVQRAAHAVSRQRVDIVGLGLFQELRYVRSGNGVAIEARFEALESECCQHQQPRNKRDEQPRHKGEVNTAKVSAGSRIVTGRILGGPTRSVR